MFSLFCFLTRLYLDFTFFFPTNAPFLVQDLIQETTVGDVVPSP